MENCGEESGDLKLCKCRLNSLFFADENDVTLNSKVFNARGLVAVASVAENVAGAGVEYLIGGKTTINLLNTNRFCLKDVYGNTSRTRFFEMTLAKKG